MNKPATLETQLVIGSTVETEILTLETQPSLGGRVSTPRCCAWDIDTERMAGEQRAKRAERSAMSF